VTTHRLSPTAYYNVLGTMAPVLVVADGDTVVTVTVDAIGDDKDGNRVARGPNPMNGPICIDGAEPGDALRVDILQMLPARATGWSRNALAANVVDPDACS
jgi:amidase